MSADDNSRSSGQSDPLQFDVAESATPSDAGGEGAAARSAQTCAHCSAPIVASYYEVNGLIVCPRCRGALGSNEGSRWKRGFIAVGLGLVAAIGGSILYYAIAALTGYEFGLVAIVVGFMVGKAVNKGSRGRGGWAYQTLAIVLTYFAIVSTYIPLAVREFRVNPTQADSLSIASAKHGMSADADSLADVDDADDADDVDAAARSDSAAAGDTSLVAAQAGTPLKRNAKSMKLGAGTILLGIVGLLVLAAIMPILAGFSNIIGLVIIGIAVFEAWKLNKRVELEISGPYRMGRGSEGAPASG